jgi:hypothetical protein
VLGVGLSVGVRVFFANFEEVAQVLVTIRAVLAGVAVLAVLLLGMLPFLESGPTVNLLRGVRGLWAAARDVVLSVRARRLINFLAFVTITVVSYTACSAITDFFGDDLDAIAPAPEVAWGWPIGGLLVAAVVAFVLEKLARRNSQAA